PDLCLWRAWAPAGAARRAGGFPLWPGGRGLPPRQRPPAPPPRGGAARREPSSSPAGLLLLPCSGGTVFFLLAAPGKRAQPFLQIAVAVAAGIGGRNSL